MSLVLRRSLVIGPLVAAFTAALGATMDAIWLALVASAALGLVVSLMLARAIRRRIRSEERGLERVLDDLAAGVLRFRSDGLAYANAAAQELFGCARHESRTPLEILGVGALADALAEARETGRTVDVEVRRSDAELGARASPAGGGEVVLIVTDLTGARRVEAMRRDFVTNASHELKTPVAAMQALSESLSMAMDRDADRARGMVERLQTEGERLATLVRDLLDLARLEEGAPTSPRRVDLSEVVRVQCERLSRLAEDRGVRIDCDCPESAPIIALPEDLRLVVGNLLENAVLYNREGGKVQASVRRDGGDVLLEVSDTGIGIPQGDLDRIFERFYRVDKARSRLAGGTGLGLSLVRHAVQRQGGSVEVTSVLGKGSTFRVVLPVEGKVSV